MRELGRRLWSWFTLGTHFDNKYYQPGIRCLFDPGFGILKRCFPDLGSWIPNPIFLSFESLMTFWVKSSIILCKLIFRLQFKNKIVFNFVIFVATKMVGQQIVFTPLYCYCFWIRDPNPRSGINKIQDPGFGIRDKHPGSATLLQQLKFFF